MCALHRSVLLVSALLLLLRDGQAASGDDEFYQDPLEHPLPRGGAATRGAYRKHPPAAEEFRIEWRYAEPQQDCNSTCGALQCSDEALAAVNSSAAINEVVASVADAPACEAFFQAVPGSEIDHNLFAPFDCAGAGGGGCCVGVRTAFALPAPPPRCSTVPVGVETTPYRRYCPCVVPCIQPCEYCKRLCSSEGVGHGLLGDLGCFKRCSARFDKVRAVLDGYCEAGGACQGEGRGDDRSHVGEQATGGEEAASLLQQRVAGPSQEEQLVPETTAASCRRPCDYCDQLCGEALGLRLGQRSLCRKTCLERFGELEERVFGDYCFHGACGHPFPGGGEQPAGGAEDEQASLLQQGVQQRLAPEAEELDEL